MDCLLGGVGVSDRLEPPPKAQACTVKDPDNLIVTYTDTKAKAHGWEIFTRRTTIPRYIFRWITLATVGIWILTGGVEEPQ